MERNGPTGRDRRARPGLPDPLPADWLVMTDADRLLSRVPDAVSRTSRWQGNSG